MRRLENTFSWSSSRAATFDRCLRNYWWQYYGSWGGWEADAPAESREAYVLKNLSNRWAWVGTVVHERIEKILKRLQDAGRGGRLQFDDASVDVHREVEALTRRMREQFRQSRDGRYRDRPKRQFGLMEHEYGDPVSDETWREVNARAKEALTSFLGSAVFADIRDSDPAGWFPIESLDQFELDGVGVWAVPDFARRVGPDGAEIYDWKTGRVNPEGNRLQLACYTLYTHEKHGVDPERVRNHLVYLGSEVVVHDFVLSAAELEEATDAMRRSMAAMRERLADPEANRADREDFPLTDDLEKCRSCVYRRLCGR